MHEELTPVKRALLEIRQLRKRVEELERSKNEPIAIIGVGLRFPGGVSDLPSFWDLLSTGRDAITEIPGDRWDLQSFFDPEQGRSGKMYGRHGAFLDHVDQFDAEFFGITPREAASIDPQHRLLLEVAWEALENAGIAPLSLSGTPAGVFIGLSNSDYLRKLVAGRHEIDAYSAIGGAPAIAAGRISYALGIQGPSLVIDTACSSSLVAVHAACQSLRLGESSMALAGGVNLILSPEMNISLSGARMLARDGRCKTFDAQADGYVRGEGCGIVVLKRVSEAIAAGDQILGVIRGSAVNQDGRSAGITAPNGVAQEAVIATALAQAGLEPAAIDYVEAHGTGTPLGDPIEVQALAHAYRKNCGPDQALRIGSVKTNIGHLESAAGIAGLIKTVAAMKWGAIPAHLNLKQPNPYIEWSSLPVEVVTSKTSWPAGSRPRIAGISAFGFSGTNCHLLLEEPPPAERPAGGLEPALRVLNLSAKNRTALVDLGLLYQKHLAATSDSLADISYTANAGRSHHSHRLSIRVSGVEEAQRRLIDWQAGKSVPEVTEGIVDEGAPRVAFLFTGQGSQYGNMAEGLYRSSPVFRSAMDECDAISRRFLPRPLTSFIFSGDADTAIHETAIAQPALFAVEYALAELWRSWGVVPSVVLGHSIGEYAAACVAGVLKLGDALPLVFQRGALMQNLPRNGGMAAIFAPEAAVRNAISGLSDRIAVAAVNGPDHIVVSGENSALQQIVEEFTAAGTRTRQLLVSHAFHSPLMDPMLKQFEDAAGAVEFAGPRMALISNLTGKPESELLRSPVYWRRHARECVRFADGMQAIFDRGPHVFVEIGPQPVLTSLLLKQRPEQTGLESLRKGFDDWSCLLQTLQVLYTCGVPVNWSGVDRGYTRHKVALPTYPFQRKRCWFGPAPQAELTENRDLAWSELTAAAAKQSEVGPLGWEIAGYGERWASLERLTAAHIQNTLVALGAFQTPGASLSPPDLTAQYGVPATYLKLLERRMNHLAEIGVLERRGARYASAHGLKPVDLAPPWREVEAHLHDNPALLAYLRQCGKQIVSVIAGRASPLETLFPDGSFELAEDLYERSSEAQYSNPIVAAAVRSAARVLSGRADLRILEIGGGTGSTTSALLPVLQPERTEYWFTDLSDQFLARASEKFAAFPFVRYARLDLDRPFEPQGIAAQQFDMVVAANVVHAVRDLGAALGRLRSSLTPGGMLVLLETTTHHSWFDMTTGLIEGWQKFDDGYRFDHPLLEADKWIELLKLHGFQNAERYPRAGSYAEATGQHIIVARVPTLLAASVTSSGQAPLAELKSGRGGGRSDQGAAAKLLEVLREAREAERLEMITDYLRGLVKRVLRLGEDRELGSRERFTDLGMDSLMALELKGALARELAQSSIPSTIAFDTGTAEELGKALLKILFQEQKNPAVETETASGEALTAEQLSEMSDEEVEAMMMERLRTN